MANQQYGKMVQQYEPMVRNLVDIVGIEPSKLIVEPDKSYINFLHDIRLIARAFIDKNKITSIQLYLPYSHNSIASFSPFSLKVIKDFKISSVHITYHLAQHPEFNDILKELMQREISSEKLTWAHASVRPFKEYSMPFLTDILIWLSTKFHSPRFMSFYGDISYMFGTSAKEDICVQFDPMISLNKLVPRVRHQSDQEHDCISGRKIPVNPFEPSLCYRIEIMLMPDNSAEGISYLYETLDGLLVPSDGIALIGKESTDKDGGNCLIASYGINNFLQVGVPKPESKENWLKHVAIARRLEEMFRAK